MLQKKVTNNITSVNKNNLKPVIVFFSTCLVCKQKIVDSLIISLNHKDNKNKKFKKENTDNSKPKLSPCIKPTKPISKGKTFIDINNGQGLTVTMLYQWYLLNLKMLLLLFENCIIYLIYY